MVLDTACMRAVEGMQNRKRRPKVLGRANLSMLTQPEHEVFRFGISRSVSRSRNTSPQTISGNPFLLNSSEIEENESLPLLASQGYMDTLQTILEVHSKKVHFIAIQALDVPLFRTSTGHIAIEIADFSQGDFPDDLSSWIGSIENDDCILPGDLPKLSHT